MARSATRPHSSIRPNPYSTSSGTTGTSGTAATGRRRATVGLLCSRPPGRARGGIRGAMVGAVMAASPRGGAGTALAGRRAAGLRVRAMPVLREISRVWVSEGGLEHLSWWYIPESGIHHQPKLTRQGPPGSAFRRRIAAAPPGPHDQSEHLTCGNDDRGQPESSCRPGPDGGIRTAALHHLAGMVTASRCCPEVPAPQPQPPRTSPDDPCRRVEPP